MTIENAEGKQETIDSTPEHPFYVEGLGWVEASSLHAGMTIWFANGIKGTVEDISNEGLEEPVTVYNFKVEGFHTYFVGESGVLVHNTCTNDTNITPQMEEIILHGERKDPAKNQLIGGHSPDINNANPNYAVEKVRVKMLRMVQRYVTTNIMFSAS